MDNKYLISKTTLGNTDFCLSEAKKHFENIVNKLKNCLNEGNKN